MNMFKEIQAAASMSVGAGSSCLGVFPVQDNWLTERDLLLSEVHHRMKNSFHAVQASLLLQAKEAAAAGLDLAASSLRNAAHRIRAAAAVHERLYRTPTRPVVAVPELLADLLADLTTSLTGPESRRPIHLAEAADVFWPAPEATSLGLVMTELVINALKHGSGAVTVRFRQGPEGEATTLTVSDEGTDLPSDFDPGVSRGLGLRLVRTLLHGRGRLIASQNGEGRTCFTAVFKLGPGGARQITELA